MYFEGFDGGGFTTFKGNFFLNEQLRKTDKSTNFSKISRLIVIIHEVFGHVKRIKYSNFKNVLETTPESVVGED
jgi:hypothetical protein